MRDNAPYAVGIMYRSIVGHNIKAGKDIPWKERDSDSLMVFPDYPVFLISLEKKPLY